jgi:hypothetical protein
MKGMKLDCRFLNYGYTAEFTMCCLLTVILLIVFNFLYVDDGLSSFGVVEVTLV